MGKAILEFNQRNRKLLINLCEGMDDVRWYRLNYEKYDDSCKNKDNTGIIVQEITDMDKIKMDDKYLEYLWCIFEYGDTKYRVSMFSKDFDEGSGNIHTLPGVVELWRWDDNISESKGIIVSKDSVKRKPKWRIKEPKYEHKGGTFYVEGFWNPLFEGRIASKRIVPIPGKEEQFVDNFKNWFIHNQENSDIEWGACCKKVSIIHTKDLLYELYEKETTKGKSSYIIVDWEDDPNGKTFGTHHKTVYVNNNKGNEGYFCIYEKKMHTYDISRNRTGPNFFDVNNQEWKLEYDEI